MDLKKGQIHVNKGLKHKKSNNRRSSIPDKSLSIASKVYKNTAKKKYHDSRTDGRKSLTCKKNFETVNEFSMKPPLKNKNNEEHKKTKKKRDDILRLNKKKKSKMSKNEQNQLLNSMSTSLHPMLKLADDSIKKINNQLNYDSLHHNSLWLKTSTNSGKSKNKRGFKIANKVSQIISPNKGKFSKPITSMTLNSNTLKPSLNEFNRELETNIDTDDLVNHVINLDQKTDRYSDATTLKEDSKERLNENVWS